MALPKAERSPEEWQTASGCLMGAAEARDFLCMPRIGMLGGIEPGTWSTRKDTHGTDR